MENHTKTHQKYKNQPKRQKGNSPALSPHFPRTLPALSPHSWELFLVCFFVIFHHFCRFWALFFKKCGFSFLLSFLATFIHFLVNFYIFSHFYIFKHFLTFFAIFYIFRIFPTLFTIFLHVSRLFDLSPFSCHFSAIFGHFRHFSTFLTFFVIFDIFPRFSNIVHHFSPLFAVFRYISFFLYFIRSFSVFYPVLFTVLLFVPCCSFVHYVFLRFSYCFLSDSAPFRRAAFPLPPALCCRAATALRPALCRCAATPPPPPAFAAAQRLPHPPPRPLPPRSDSPPPFAAGQRLPTRPLPPRSDSPQAAVTVPLKAATCIMPRHVIADAHEWIDPVPTVPIHHPATPQPRERARDDQRGKKTLLRLTPVQLCDTT